MLQLQGISKRYHIGELVQIALNQVSLNFRENEFVSILGPSGSGKTTLLNIIGGLDRYDSGNLIINGISTNNYKDKDWDAYRNHSVGFVFQSYNLIPHQSVLANVELALTIGGISAKERKERAAKALDQVGLREQMHKKPNQLSGGQMQRVAIARALVNEPDILLADEPTGALDTGTSVQVMELLKEVAKDRLVIMVTHNPDLAERYSTRIVRLVDGRITGDTNPYDPFAGKAEPEGEPENARLDKGKAKVSKGQKLRTSMSFLTALSLSFHNLGTKKGRTILTSLAGSIGIIGIALILGLSTGVNSYIKSVQKGTMTSYPISIEAQTMNMNTMMGDVDSAEAATEQEEHTKGDAIYSNGEDLELENQFNSSIHENDLTSFKEYLEKKDSNIHPYIGENGIVYSYNTPFSVYAKDPDGVLVNTDGSTLLTPGIVSDGAEMTSADGSVSMEMGTDFTAGVNAFQELSPGSNGEGISKMITDNYDLVYGKLPKNYDEVVLVLDSDGEIPLQQLYALGYLPSAEYEALINSVAHQKDFQAPEYSFGYEEMCDHTFSLVPACDFYEKQEDGFYRYREVSDEPSVIAAGITLKVAGIIRPKEDVENVSFNGTVGYTRALTDYLIDYANQSDVVKAQLADKNTDVRSGIQINEESYGANLSAFGYVDREKPQSINIYADDFEDKEGITDCIEEYNKTVDEEKKIVYTDLIELLVSSVTTIVDVISYVLIAFVAVSLIVSSLMIGIITYISVLERTKEIGILRAMGASKGNVSQVFIAETFLVGLAAGIVGIGISELLLLVANIILGLFEGSAAIHASLPAVDALLLIVLSIGLTVLGGLIPAVHASGKNPVTALRSE